jgi:SAM-dependent methyltransferase
MTKNVDVGRLYLAETPTELMAEYDRVADGYDTALVTDHEWRAPEIMGGIAAWLLPRSARLLDAACGTGLVAESLAHFGFADIQGLDFSPGMLAVAARKNVYTGLTEAALGDALPFRNGEFDAFLVCGAFTPSSFCGSPVVAALRSSRCAVMTRRLASLTKSSGWYALAVGNWCTRGPSFSPCRGLSRMCATGSTSTKCCESHPQWRTRR